MTIYKCHNDCPVLLEDRARYRDASNRMRDCWRAAENEVGRIRVSFDQWKLSEAIIHRSLRNQRNKLHRQLIEHGIDPCIDLNDVERNLIKEKYADRNDEICRLCDQEVKRQIIGNKFGLSAVRIGQIYNREKRRRQIKILRSQM